MSAIIRPALPEDAQGMIDILNPIIRAGDTTAIPDEYSLAEQKEFLLGLGPKSACHVAVEDGRIVGFQTIEPHDGLPPDVVDIATFVRIGEKGRGVGARLTRATAEAAQKLGYAAINATIRADNAEGLAFYTKMGFRDHAIARAVPLKTGKRVDRLSKRRLL